MAKKMKVKFPKKMTKKESARAYAIMKKAAILASPQFKEWWKWRQTFYPTPSDPYRAFMIDCSLYARVHHKEVWRHRTNRMDYPPIDLPKMAPAPKRRLPPRKHIKRFKRVPKAAQPIPLTPFEKELVKETEKFREKYHLPFVKLKIEKRARASYIPQLFGTPMILMPKGYVASGAKIKGVRQQVVATLSHEEGHFAHSVYGTSEKAMERGLHDLAGAITGEYGRGRIEEERVAWKVAKLHRGLEWTPIMGWRKKFALGTYLRTTPPRIRI